MKNDNGFASMMPHFVLNFGECYALIKLTSRKICDPYNKRVVFFLDVSCSYAQIVGRANLARRFRDVVYNNSVVL